MPCLNQENNTECYQLLADGHDWCNTTCKQDYPRPHLFGDILDLIQPGAFLSEDSYQTKLARIRAANMVMQQTCAHHTFSPNDDSQPGSFCDVLGADFGCSGLPCTDMSKAGLKRKRHGPTNSVYISHGKYAEQKKVPVFVVECTPVT